MKIFEKCFQDHHTSSAEPEEGAVLMAAGWYHIHNRFPILTPRVLYEEIVNWDTRCAFCIPCNAGEVSSEKILPKSLLTALGLYFGRYQHVYVV